MRRVGTFKLFVPGGQSFVTHEGGTNKYFVSGGQSFATHEGGQRNCLSVGDNYPERGIIDCIGFGQHLCLNAVLSVIS